MVEKLKILISYLVLIGLFVYLVFALNYSAIQSDKVVVSDLKIIVRDSAKFNFVTNKNVSDWLVESKLQYLGEGVNKLNTNELQRVFTQKNFVQKASVYTDLKGVLTIEITQRTPQIRFIVNKAHSFYVTHDNHILPVQNHSSHYVPIVTGELDLPFEKGFVGDLSALMKNNEKKSQKNYVFFTNLVNFVKFISDDKFWNAQIVQINIVKSPKSADHELNNVSNSVNTGSEYLVELIPRAGDCTIMMGEIEGFEQKLEKLSRFYHESLPFEGWKNIRYINLMFDSQVVVTK